MTDQEDLQVVFERKIQELQGSFDLYFVFSGQKPYEPPRDFQWSNGLLEDIRQSYLRPVEQHRLNEEAAPKPVLTHRAPVEPALPAG